jgi:KDO2-lipid IV(A) lauroyltransferase
MHAGAWLINRIGYRRALALAAAAGDLLYRLPSRMKSRILHNLQFALGDALSPDERRNIARRVMHNIAKNWFELFYYGGGNKKAVEDTVSFEGKENLDRALSRGRGVIAVSAHLSNYPILAQQFSRKGYTFVMVIRDPASRVIAAMYEKGRELIELRSLLTLPERRFYREALSILKSNGILCLIADENKRHGGIFVDFFGHQASTPPGPAALALRTGAPIVPVFLLRNPDNSLRVIVERELVLQKTGDDQQDMQSITAAFTRLIEDYVRRDPAQWMWTNFRWRTQPWGQSDAAKLKKRSLLKKIKKRLHQAG